jgi:hypothetical protein
MVGGGAFRHAYHRAPDGKTLIYNVGRRLVVQRGERSRTYDFRWRSPGEFEFCPKKPTLVATWSPSAEGQSKGITLLDLSELGPKLAAKELYRSSKGSLLFSFRWSPKGDSLLAYESSDEGWVWREVPLEGGAVITHGKPSKSPLQIMVPYLRQGKLSLLVGDEEGLLLLSGPKPGLRVSGLVLRRLVDRAHLHVGGKNLFALACRGATTGGERARGVYLVDLERLVKAARAGKPLLGLEAFDRVHSSDGSKTLWFSPKGTYLTGATADEVYLRRTRDRREHPTYLSLLDSGGNPRGVRGVYWNDAETKLAVIADDEVWVYDWTAPKKGTPSQAGQDLDDLEALTGKRPVLRRVAQLRGGFLAEPQWIGDRIVISQFEDAKEEFEAQRKKLSQPLEGGR